MKNRPSKATLDKLREFQEWRIRIQEKADSEMISWCVLPASISKEARQRLICCVKAIESFLRIEGDSSNISESNERLDREQVVECLSAVYRDGLELGKENQKQYLPIIGKLLKSLETRKLPRYAEKHVRLARITLDLYKMKWPSGDESVERQMCPENLDNIEIEWPSVGDIVDRAYYYGLKSGKGEVSKMAEKFGFKHFLKDRRGENKRSIEWHFIASIILEEIRCGVWPSWADVLERAHLKGVRSSLPGVIEEQKWLLDVAKKHDFRAFIENYRTDSQDPRA